jgi:trimethylamine--corrinoid protein Co-methyltransferase
MIFTHEKAIEVFKKHGLKTDGNKVFITEDMLMNTLKSAPRSFKVCGRTPDRDFVVGGGTPALTPVSAPVFVKSGDTKRLAA